MIHTFTQTGCAHYVRLYLVEKTPLYRKFMVALQCVYKPWNNCVPTLRQKRWISLLNALLSGYNAWPPASQHHLFSMLIISHCSGSIVTGGLQL